MDGFTEALIRDYQREQDNSSYLLKQKDARIAELEKQVRWLESTIQFLREEGYRRERRN